MIAANAQNPNESTERLLERLERTNDNAEFLATLSKNDV